MNKKFTLVEVVFALGLFTLLAILSISILQTSQRLWESMNTKNNNLDNLQNIDRIANYCIKNMIPFTWHDSENKEREIFKGDSDAIIFAYLHRASGNKPSAIRFIKLNVKDKKLIASYRKTPLLYWLGEPFDDENTTNEIIADGIESITFEYAECVDDAIIWYQTWNEDDFQQIPLAVFIKIEFIDGTKDVWIRRTAGNGFYTSLGKRVINGNEQ
ncbi:hypothetical protein AAEX28_15270 [Lentisphaerota bacterium WC36G]|nr:hypothetical protein LJT99_02040 [Lentisphaerae bacterium WC36]